MSRSGDRDPTGSADFRITSARQQSVETSPGSFARDDRPNRLKNV